MAENVLEFTDANFSKEVKNATMPVLVDFWASWCAPCLAIAPHIEALAKNYDGQVKVGKLNVDENPDVAGEFGIRSIPTLLLFKNGHAVDQVIGAVSKANIQEMVSKHL